jgi:hypothetical protein
MLVILLNPLTLMKNRKLSRKAKLGKVELHTDLHYEPQLNFNYLS